MTGPVVEWTSPHRFVVEGTEFLHDYLEGSTADSFHIRKHGALAQAYVDAIRPFVGGTIVELGIANGGSAALVELLARPRRFVALELATERIPALDDLIERRGAGDRVRAHYGVDQADRDLVRSLVLDGTDGAPIDLVIDDASHLAGPTRASFETLFPLVRPGGRYLIEDWTWQLKMGREFTDRADRGAADEAWVVEQVAPGIVAGLTDPDPEARRRFTEAVEDRLRANGDDEALAELHEAIARWEASGEPAQPAAPKEAPPREVDLATLPHLAFELVLAAAREGSAIAAVEVDPFWISVTRGEAPLDPVTFRLDELVDDPLGLL